MAYTTVPTLTDVTATAAAFNSYIRDNQRALKDPPSQNYEANQGTDYSTTSLTYADVDSTNFSFSITTTGGDVLVGFSGTLAIDVGSILIDVAVDGTRIINNTSGGLTSVLLTTAHPVSFLQLVEGLSAGVHTFALQWKSTTGGTAILYAGAATAGYDVHPQFFVREIS